MNGSFSLDRPNGKLFGVCAGLARWTGINVMAIRLGFALSVIFGFGTPLLIYLLIALVAD